QAPIIEWQKCFGGSGFEDGRSILMTSDYGYLIGGNTTSNDGDVIGNHSLDVDFWIIRIDSSGNKIWQKCYGGTNEDDLYSITTSTNKGFLLLGWTGSDDGDVSGRHGLDADISAIRCDSLGNVIWQRCLGGSRDDLGYKAIFTPDSCFLIVGTAYSNDFDVTGSHQNAGCNLCSDAWAVKLDTAGNIVWSHCYGGTFSEVWNTVAVTEDSGYIFVGETGSSDGDVFGYHGSADLWIVKTNSSGAIMWQKCFGGSVDEKGYSVICTLDHGYLIGGTASSYDFDVSGNNGMDDAWILKLDSLGSLQWQSCIGGSTLDYNYSLLELSDSSFLALCYTYSNDSDVTNNHSNSSDVWLVKLDRNGDVQWQQCYGGSDIEQAFDLKILNDESLIFSGTSRSNDGDVNGNHGWFDMWIGKLSPLLDNLSFPFNSSDGFIAYSDHSNLQIKLFSPKVTASQFQLFDVSGRHIWEQNIQLVVGSNEFNFSTGSIFDGIYFLRCRDQIRKIFISNM
ncbi:MAG: hypothetical protein ABI763_12970, partial [Bacteroidota bacterium]